MRARRHYCKNYSRQKAKAVKVGFMNKLRRTNPVAFAEMRLYEAPYKPHR